MDKVNSSWTNGVGSPLTASKSMNGTTNAVVTKHHGNLLLQASGSSHNLIVDTSWPAPTTAATLVASNIYDSNNNTSSCNNNNSIDGRPSGITNKGTNNGTGCSTNASSSPLAPPPPPSSMVFVNTNDVNILEVAKNIGNEFRGEFIVLPRHLVDIDGHDGDDDDDVEDYIHGGDIDLDNWSSNLDDCVYAYRGDNLDQSQANNIINDDEEAADEGDDEDTDFLEMDFDPEPNSELEGGARGSSNALNSFPTPEMDTTAEAKDLFLFNKDTPLQSVTDQQHPIQQSVIELPIEVGPVSKPPLPVVKVTGTKPKVRPEEKDTVHSSKPEILTSNNSTMPDGGGCGIPSNIDCTSADVRDADVEQDEDDDDDENQCLDCSELEFLNHTKKKAVVATATSTLGAMEQKQCHKHNKRKKKMKHRDEADNSTPFIQISTDIFDEATIYNSLTAGGITVNRQILHEQIESHRLSLERTKTIPDYLTKYSRYGRDHKKLSKIIRCACELEGGRTLNFKFQAISDEPDWLLVDANEILSRWTADGCGSNLRDLLWLNNRHFEVANVLGKVVTLLRVSVKSTKTRDMDKLPPISIPSYYPPGFLLITKCNQ